MADYSHRRIETSLANTAALPRDAIFPDAPPAFAGPAEEVREGSADWRTVVAGIGEERSLAMAAAVRFEATPEVTPAVDAASEINLLRPARPVGRTSQFLNLTTTDHAKLRNGWTSELDGKLVNGVKGVVTHIKKSGFYIELTRENPNDPPRGFYVYVGQRIGEVAGLQVGAIVDLSGKVSWFRGMDERDASNLKVPQLSSFPDQVKVVGQGGKISDPLLIGKNGLVIPKKFMSDKSLAAMDAAGAQGNIESPGTPYDTKNDALAFLHDLIGTRIKIENAVVVGASDDRKYFYVVPDKGEGVTHFSARGTAVYTEDNFPTEVIKVDIAALPKEFRENFMTVKDAITVPLVGILEYSFGQFQLRVEDAFKVEKGHLQPNMAGRIDDRKNRYVTETRNWENVDPSDLERIKEMAFDFVVRSYAPDSTMCQEIQDNSGAADDGVVKADKTMQAIIDAIHALFHKIKSGDVSDLEEHGLTKAQIADVLASLPDEANYEAGTLDEAANYGFTQIDPENNKGGGMPGGNIRPVLLYNKARVKFTPRGNAEFTTPAQILKGTDGKPTLSHNPGLVEPNSDAFKGSRRPLVVEVEFNGEKFFHIDCHLVSKRGDSNPVGIYQPPRFASDAHRADQAREIREFIKRILAMDKDAKIIVGGDMNSFHFEKAMQELAEGGFVRDAAAVLLKSGEIYTYVHDGRAQALDHLFMSSAVFMMDPQIDIIHLNSEFPSVREWPADHGNDDNAGGRPREKKGDGRKPRPIVDGIELPPGVILQRSDHDTVSLSLLVKKS